MILEQEMINNNINKKLIDKYVKEQYEIINSEYTLKIEKYNKKINSQPTELINKLKDKNRNKEIANLIRNKLILEKNGINKEYINNYVIKEYDDIKKNYKRIKQKFN